MGVDAGGGSETSPKWARELYDQMLEWSPLAVAGVLMRFRADGAKTEDEEIAAAEEARPATASSRPPQQ